MSVFRLLIGIIIAGLLSVACSREADFVRDRARLFSPEQSGQIANFHRLLLADHDIDYRILTIAEETDINRFTGEQFEQMKVGSASKSGRGLLLVLDTAGNQVRLEVSRALEAAFPDAFVAYIEQRQMTPFFAAGRVADGLLATTELIINRAQDARENQDWDDETDTQAASSGAGATAPALLDEANRPAMSEMNIEGEQRYEAPEEPESTLRDYLQAMSNRNTNPDLAIYSADSRAMLHRWVVTPAQMDSIVRTYRACHAEAARYNLEQTLAVIRYPVNERACSPWFFVRDGNNWQLDLSSAQRSVRFGRDNSWHFDWRAINQHPYQFAFSDWAFDNRGYPQRMRWNLTAASDKDGNVWVDRVGTDSAAEAFGLQANDRLLRWNGVSLHHHQQVITALNDSEPGTPVAVDIIRDGHAMTLEGLAPPYP